MYIKEIVLALYLDLSVRDAVENICRDTTTIVSYKGEKYRVVTDKEADEIWDDLLEDYIEQSIDIPEHLMIYFDRKSWKEDEKNAGRAHWLSCDGREEQQEYEGEVYYIYKV